MTGPRRFPMHRNPWLSGLWLALLNLAIAGFAAVSFAGALGVLSALNPVLRSHAGGPTTEVPFPYPVLLALDAVVCIAAWLWFGRRLPSGGKARLVTAAVGAAPLFFASLAAGLGAVAAWKGNESDPQSMGAAPVLVLGVLATVILAAAIACCLLVLWTGGQARNR